MHLLAITRDTHHSCAPNKTLLVLASAPGKCFTRQPDTVQRDSLTYTRLPIGPRLKNIEDPKKCSDVLAMLLPK